MSTPTSYLTFQLGANSKGRIVAQIFGPPNAARRDWEFHNGSRVEALTTLLNSLAAEGWRLAATDGVDSAKTFIMVDSDA